MREPNDDALIALVHRLGVSNRPPFHPHDAHAVDVELRALVARLELQCELLSQCEFDHYGSGYASFVDAWFYRADQTFGTSTRGLQKCAGLCVIFCRHAPCFALLEGTKTWGEKAASSYLPSLDAVDQFATDAVRTLAGEITNVLADMGFTRLARAQLGSKLEDVFHIQTNLSDPPFSTFDALFQWMD